MDGRKEGEEDKEGNEMKALLVKRLTKLTSLTFDSK